AHVARRTSPSRWRSQMHSRTPALLALVVGIVPSLGCSNPSSAPDNSNLGPPVILENRIVLGSSAKLGWLRLVTQDPDGPVAVECGGAFEGVGEDSLVVSRPFADLRSQRYLSTACNATQGDTTVTTFAIMEDGTRVATLVGAGRTVIDTTLTATFDTVGFHCVVID